MKQIDCRQRRPGWRGRPVVAALVVLALGGWLLGGCGNASPPTVPAAAPAVAAVPATAAQVEERYGVQVALVALTADGGLVDVRFRVTEPAKAGFLLQAETMPMLIAENNGTVLRLNEALDQDALVQGRVYSALFPNARNAIKPGDPLSIVIGDLRLEHLPAQ